MSGSALFSDLLGYTSIACWLGAQFPQVLENFRRQSCEGLALPFIANWFLGDFSNLIGCILTNQLPFQRYLATYFCCVDLMLVLQYIYYQNMRKSSSSSTPAAFLPQRAASVISNARRLSADRSRTRYRTLSVASDIAAAVALAAKQDQDSARHATGHDSDPLLRLEDPRSFTSPISLSEDHAIVHSEDDRPTPLIDSFHSGDVRDPARKRVSWSIERPRIRADSTSRISAIAPSNIVRDLDSVRRGRSLGPSTEEFLRSTEEFLRSTEEATQASQPLSSPWNARNSRVGKKSATMVFLGTWALFGVRTFAGNKRVLPDKNNVGRVLSPLSSTRGHDIPVAVTSFLAATEPLTIPDSAQELSLTFEDQHPPPRTEPLPPPDDSKPSLERIIGRISAWLCTILYLTSRLPQIWKNYVRQSVEGLSMYLFVFAFLGNTFYVASILFSPNVYLPPPQSAAFLKESIPYLLGSGGTLIFDVTIVTQSFIYKPKHKRRHAESRGDSANLEGGGSISEGVTESERTGLLAGDALVRHHQHHQQTYSHQQSAPLYSIAASETTTTKGAMSTSTREPGLTRGRTTHVVRSGSH